jgi:hypothetical protein
LRIREPLHRKACPEIEILVQPRLEDQLINVPGAHSASRFEVLRPTFYAYFPPSRNVSKFQLSPKHRPSMEAFRGRIAGQFNPPVPGDDQNLTATRSLLKLSPLEEF